MTKEERQQVKLHTEYIKQQRKYFEYSDTSQYLLEQKKDDDLLLLQDAFMEWINKMQEDDIRKKDLTMLLQSVWRLQNYCGTLETICKSSVVRIVELNKSNNRFESEKRILELEIIQLKSKHELEKKRLEEEIKFISKSS